MNDAPATDTSAAAGPLAGVRVIDLGRFLAAPWCAQILGDLGAEVIKIERAGSGDPFRQYGPPFLEDADGKETPESSYYLCTNRNKKSVSVDLTTAAGQDIVRRLAAKSDVLIENFRTGDLKRYGLDEDSLAAVNPDLVYCSITAFGQTGPYARRPGLDSVFQAMSGLMSVTGDADGPPQKVGVSLMDIMAGMYSTIGILAALRSKEVLKGGGQYLDIALMDTALAIMSHRAQDYLLTGEPPQRVGTGTTGTAPAQIFATSDGSINIQAGDTPAFHKLCRLFALPDLIGDERYAGRSDRWRNRATLIPVLAVEFAKRTTAQVYEELTELSIVAAPIYDLSQTFEDPQVIHRGMRREVEHELGTIPILGSPINFSKTPTTAYTAPPSLGRHNDEVLRGLLGLSGDEVEELRRTGAI